MQTASLQHGNTSLICVNISEGKSKWISMFFFYFCYFCVFVSGPSGFGELQKDVNETAITLVFCVYLQQYRKRSIG